MNKNQTMISSRMLPKKARRRLAISRVMSRSVTAAIKLLLWEVAVFWTRLTQRTLTQAVAMLSWTKSKRASPTKRTSQIE